MKNQAKWILLIPFLISSTSWTHLCFACSTDEDCAYSYCCQIDSGDYRCNPCDFCITDNDCHYEAERCDQSQRICTTTCSLDSECRENHKCDLNNCVYQEKEEDSMDAGSVLVIIAIITGAILFGCCCHFCTKKRREEQLTELRANATAVPGLVAAATQNPSNNETPVYIFHLQGNNSERNVNAEQIPIGSNSHEEDQPISDPIVESGPPPYSCLTRTDEPQSPPPSYDEALRASTENLATTQG